MALISEMKRLLFEKEIDKLLELAEEVKNQADELSGLLRSTPNYEQHPTQELLRYAELMGSCIIPVGALVRSIPPLIRNLRHSPIQPSNRLAVMQINQDPSPHRPQINDEDNVEWEGVEHSAGELPGEFKRDLVEIT